MPQIHKQIFQNLRYHKNLKKLTTQITQSVISELFVKLIATLIVFYQKKKI